MSIPGMRQGTVRKKRRKCPQRKSAAKSDISTILTMNSRAGCDQAADPSPRPYPDFATRQSPFAREKRNNVHLPDHQARFVSSCLNSRERKSEMATLKMSRWILHN